MDTMVMHWLDWVVVALFFACSFSYRLQIWQPRKPYKPLKALTWLECP